LRILCDVLCDFGGGSDLIGASDPTGAAKPWKVEYIDRAAAIGLISCPTPAECLAFDHDGNLIVGAAAYSKAQIKMNIRGTLTALRRARIGALLKPRGYRTVFTAPVAGRIKLTLDLTVSASAPTRRVSQILIASRSVSYRQPGELLPFAIKLNRIGQRLLKHRRSATLEVTVRFRTTNGHPQIVSTQRLALRR
jgi:hypothetical protein